MVTKCSRQAPFLIRNANHMSDETKIPHALRPKQQKFVEEYLVDLNGKQAAVRAGYAAGSAHVTASRLLSRPDIRNLVASALGDRFGVTHCAIVEELAAIAFHNIGDYMDWAEGRVSVVPSSKLTAYQLKAISAAKSGTSGSMELRFYDKLRALELLARALGFEDTPILTPDTPKVQVVFEPA